MHFVDVFIRNPVKVAVGVILIVLFGLLTVTPPSIAPSPIRVPVQLTPNLDQPIVSVSTYWEGASPEEVEREIIEPQEEVLKGVDNLRKMTSSSRNSSCAIELEFNVGTNLDVAKQEVSDALRRVTYQIPLNEFDNPIVKSGREWGEEAIAWMVLSSDDPAVKPPELFTFVDKDVRPMLERVEGVSSVQVFGGREREIQVVVDALKLAQAGVTFGELQAALTGQNTNVSAGNSAQGKRDIVIRTMGQFTSLDDIRLTVIKTGEGGPIRVGDVAEARDTFKKRYSFVRSEGKEVLALPAFREAGSNVIEVMERLRAAIARVNAEMLAPRGMQLELAQVYDETTYITSAINLVRSNIVFGGLLAIAVLLVFLRSLSGTAVVALAIPISIIGTFLIVPLAGRNMNVVMLAGLAFAVGMVVDNSIVVLENIFRHREMGKPRREAASDGASEVWGAVVANSLTTMIVFLPILFVKEEAGQLFRDIAIAISGAVALSLLVSVTVIPALASRILAKTRQTGGEGGGRTAAVVAGAVRSINRHIITRVLVVGGFTAASVWLSMWLAPEPSYLPSGNQNFIFGFLVTPPGYNTVEFEKIAVTLENGDPATGQIGLRPFWEVEEGTPEYERLLDRWSQMVEGYVVPGLDAQIETTEQRIKDPVTSREERRKARRRVRELEREIAEWRVPPPPLEDFFFVAWSGGCFMGGSSRDPTLVKPLEKVLNSTGSAVPDSFPIFFQASIFGNLGSGNSVDVEIRGDDLGQVVEAARNVMTACTERFGSRPEANPMNFALDRREDQLVPDRVRAGELGLSVAEIGLIARACGDGRIIGQYREAGKSIDLTIKVAGTEDPITARSATDMIANIPIWTPVGQIVPLTAVCGLDRTTAPQQINHIETQRSVKLTVRPPEGLSLPEVIDTVENDIIAPMRAGGYGKAKSRISPEVIVSLAGNADKLESTWDSLKWLLALSLLVVYLLMSGLFESFAYPLVIIFTVPFAVVGGFIGLAIVNQWTWMDPTMAIQQLDMLTILGFVILLGIVVNNGILIVHQSLNFISYGKEPREAIPEAVRTRIRPIFMTVLTTFFGQLLLVVRPGAGAELYRGLGAVVLGGLIFSTLFTLVVVPAMLSLFIGARVHVSSWIFGRSA
ncbi:MAG: efflux RND transporter permease subunit [Phycisphaerae bacterium]|nr:efflux RND transporter permease subunit [Phycisphaerae bacterium]